MTPTEEFPKLLDLALAEAKEETRRLVNRYALANFPAWEFDSRGRLVFRGSGRDELSLPAQLVGFHRPAESLWQWAWDDPKVPGDHARSATAARDWGQAQGIESLTSPTTFADEPLAWRLTAFAARLTGFPAVYRGPSGPRYLYFAFAGPNA